MAVLEVFPPLCFDVIASSPPCTEYSRALTSRSRNLAAAVKIVLAALEIIGYSQPTFWFMENPQRGLLIDRDFMNGRPYVDVDFCMFTDWGYQNPTRLWGSPALGNLSHRTCN